MQRQDPIWYYSEIGDLNEPFIDLRAPLTCNGVDVHPGVTDVGDFVVQESEANDAG